MKTNVFDFQIESNRTWNPDDAFETLFSHGAPVFWFFFLLTGLSLFVLRYKDPYRERPFTVPGYPVLPLIFCAMCVYMLYRSTIFVKQGSLFAAALVLVAHAAGVSNAMTVLGAQLFLWARAAFAVIYIIGIPYLRTAAWTVAVVGLVLIFLQVV